MVVKHITKSTFDVFFDSGWENWARYEVTNGKLKQIAGLTPPKNIFMFLNKRYSK